MTQAVSPLTCPVWAKCAGLSLIMQKIMAFILKCCFLYSSDILTPCSQSFYMFSINGSKKPYMSMPACLGPDLRVVNRRYFRLWHNHGGRLYIHTITSQVLYEFLISPKGFIPFLLRPNLTFLGSLEKNCFHCLPLAGCQIFSFLFHSTYQHKS
jgi:hypothetical protein